MGCCALAHIIQLLKRPREVRAAQRAFLLPYQEGAAVQALCSCGDAQGMCFDWLAPVGSRRWIWISESWSESEGLSSSDFRNHNVESLALHVVGPNWSGGKVSLFLEDCEPARMALSCHVALDMLCQEMHAAARREPFVTASESLSLWTSCDRKERDVARENEGRRNVSDRLKCRKKNRE